jgi:phosphomannomutase
MNDINNIFKAYDVRGKVGTELTAETVEKIGKAMADWLPQAGVVAVGHDMRPDSSELAKVMIKGLTTQGRDVIDVGLVSSDMIYFAAGKYNLAGGAVITASHNPGEYNGIKFCREEAKPISLETGLEIIRDNVISETFKKSAKQGAVSKQDITEDWIDHVLTFVDVSDLKPLRIAVDAGNGMMGKVFPELEPYVPFEVTEMYFELDGTFPNHPASPVESKNLQDLIKVVKQQKCDVGLAFDGDGDRAVVVDEKGEPISGTVMTSMLAEYFLSKKPGSTILHNAIVGRMARETIQKYGGKAVRTKVGHSIIKNDMRVHDALFAGEHSHHYYFRDNYMADSGLIAAMVALALLSKSNAKLSKLADRFRKYSSIEETNFEVTDKEAMMQKIADSFKGAGIDWLDGITLTFKDGWVNVRPSNTEPLLRLNAEADTKDRLDYYVKEVTKIIQS